MNWDATILWSRGLGFIAAAALFWLQYFDLKDFLHPEPRRRLLQSYLLGAAAALAGLALYWSIDLLGGPADPGTSRSEILLYCFLVVGPLEEGVKFLAARLFIFRTMDFDEPIDGLIYSSAVSIGFASVESLVYTPLLQWPYLLARTVTSPLTHSLFASIWGFGTGIAFFRARSSYSRFLWQAIPWFIAAVVHGLYDFALLSTQATFVAAGLALLLWTFLIAFARHLLRARGRKT